MEVLKTFSPVILEEISEEEQQFLKDLMGEDYITAPRLLFNSEKALDELWDTAEQTITKSDNMALVDFCLDLSNKLCVV